MTTQLNDILKLSIQDRILLMETIWESVVAEKKLKTINLSEKTNKNWDEKLARPLVIRKPSSSWEEVKAEIEQKLLRELPGSN